MCATIKHLRSLLYDGRLCHHSHQQPSVTTLDMTFTPPFFASGGQETGEYVSQPDCNQAPVYQLEIFS